MIHLRDRGSDLRLLYESNVNIEGISRGIMEGSFGMTMAIYWCRCTGCEESR